jgi:hypothetical protein
MKNTLLVAGLLLMVILPGCSKYDDGPFLSLYSREKRISGNWIFDKVTIEGADSTQYYLNHKLTFSYFKDADAGIFKWYKNVYATSLTDENYKEGIWQFIGDTDSLEMDFIDPYDGDTLKSAWRISRLAYQEIIMQKTVPVKGTIEWRLSKSMYYYY